MTFAATLARAYNLTFPIDPLGDASPHSVANRKHPKVGYRHSAEEVGYRHSAEVGFYRHLGRRVLSHVAERDMDRNPTQWS